ncbi:proprotein convertase subtilisin/kexin type 7-like [Tubulanus polymorphus]|uniref:proprotein convertase subtilisin/kexin type 7-like n=1 Tax=Tubulanus polymorphus TaxID=672921 RepID=UPI003DA52EBE
MADLGAFGLAFLALVIHDVAPFVISSHNHSKHLISAGDREGDERLSWGVQIVNHERFTDSGAAVAAKIAENLDLKFRGKIADLPGVFRLSHRSHTDEKQTGFSAGSLPDFVELRDSIQDRFQSDDNVEWFTQFIWLKRVGRTLPAAVRFNDPQFKNQWHLYNGKNRRYDINVTGVWMTYNITGRGVTVCIVDDGVEWRNPDLVSRYEPDGSWDLNDDDPDPSPHPAKKTNQHGTRCAGEVVATANNSFCGVGVAYEAKVSGIRLLDGPITDSLEAEAFYHKLDINFIENLSWGPSDDGKTIDAPHVLAQKALQRGVTLGRGGYGTVYVIPGGNGGMHKDNCNYDGYANSIYTVTINAVDEHGRTPFYAELCAASLASTFSGGNNMFLRRITTTDWDFDGGNGCTNKMSGTSASTPIAAGIIALMLEAKPCLSYRDVKYIIIMSAKKVDDIDGQWITNEAGLHHNHFIGFGIIDAFRAVSVTKIWTPVPMQVRYSHQTVTVEKMLPKYPMEYGGTVVVREEDLIGISLLEYVQVTVTVKTYRRGNLVIYLKCPSGTKSILTSVRPKDKTEFGLTGWTMTSARCWGERPYGEYTITIIDNDEEIDYQYGQVSSWQLHLTGTPLTYEQFMERRRLVMDTIANGFVNQSKETPCWSAPAGPGLYELEPMSGRLLKMLAFTCIFCLIMLWYEMMEYMCCYAEEKQESSRQMRRVRRAQKMGLIDVHQAPESSPSTTINEQTRLLAPAGAEENIAMSAIDSNRHRDGGADHISERNQLLGDEGTSHESIDDGFVDFNSSNELCNDNCYSGVRSESKNVNYISTCTSSLSQTSTAAETNQQICLPLNIDNSCNEASSSSNSFVNDSQDDRQGSLVKDGRGNLVSNIPSAQNNDNDSVIENILNMPDNEGLVGVDLLYGLSKEEIELNMNLAK